MTKTNTFKDHLQRAILVTCDIWDTDYIPDNWEPEFMTIIVYLTLILFGSNIIFLQIEIF